MKMGQGIDQPKLTRGRHILLAVVGAVLIPMAFAVFGVEQIKHSHDLERINSDFERSAKILASGLETPVWRLDREAGEKLVDTFAESPSVVGVRVHSIAQDRFLEFGSFPENQPDEYFELSRDIAHEGQIIGRVDVLYDSTPYINAQSEKWVFIWGLFAIALLIIIGAVFWYLKSIIVSERLEITDRARDSIQSHTRHVADTARNVDGVVFQCVIDKDGKIEFPFMSDSVHDYFGLTADAVMQNPNKFCSRMPAEHLETFRTSLMHAAVGNKEWAWEGNLIGSSGNIIHMRGAAQARPYKDGLTLWNGVLSDISELENTRAKVAKARANLEEEVALRTKRLISEIEKKVEIETSLRDNEQRFKDFTESATDWVWETDRDHTITFLSVNSASSDLFDTSKVIGRSRYDVFNASADDENENWAKHFEDVAKRKEFQDFEFGLVDLYGEKRTLRINGRPIFDTKGQYTGYRGTGKDVTQETESKQNLEKLRAAFEAIPQPIAVLDADDRFEFFNSAYEKMHQKCPTALKLGTKFSDFLRKIVDGGVIEVAIGKEDEWLQKRLELHRKDSCSLEVKHAFNKWYLVNEHSLSTGGRAIMVPEITDLKESQQSLKEAKDQAEAANEAKSDFLSSMSHELRTPLHAILGYAQLLERDTKGNLDERQDKFIRQIVGSGNHLLGLIGDVLDLAQIESGNLAISLAPVSVPGLINDTIESASFLAETRNVTLRVGNSYDDDIPKIFADPTRVRQVLLNLASNGIKYTRENGIVELDAELIGHDRVRMSVSDNGFGIPDDKKTELFKSFSRLGMEKSNIQGTGIGLAISKAIIENMGGEIGFESDVHNGTRFWFDLPIADEHSKPSKKPSERSQSFRVLHINESVINTELLEIALSERPGLDFIKSISGSDILDQIREEMPDIMFVDMDKDEEGRLMLIQSIKECPDTKHIPVIVLNLNRTERSRRRALDAGVTECLTMPMEPEQVYEQIEKVRSSSETIH